MDKLAELEKELLADMEENPVEYTETVNSVFEIDSNLRTINIPVTVKNIGVESDDDVKRLEFTMPKQYGEFDLSQFRIRINYVNANGDKSIYLVEDKKVSGDNITFSWLVGRNVTKYKGQVNFIVCLKLSDEKGEILKELNTTLCRLEVLEGLEVVPVIDEKTTDIIEQLLRMVETETTGTVQKVTEEGKKQVQAVQKAAQEIAADREQIQKNAKNVTTLNENLGRLSHKKLLNGFDKNNVEIDKYYNSSGVLSKMEGWTSSLSYAEVEPNNKYYSKTPYEENLKVNIVWYDSDKSIIKQEANTIFTSPPDAKYVRISCYSGHVENLVFGANENVTEYINYKTVTTLNDDVVTEKLDSDIDDVSDLVNYTADAFHLHASGFTSAILRNGFDKSTAIDGKYFTSTGKIKPSDGWCLNENYLYINPKTRFYAISDGTDVKNVTKVAWYDKRKKFISLSENTEFIAPENAYFMRLCCGMSIKNTFVFTEKNVATGYADYGYDKKIKDDVAIPASSFPPTHSFSNTPKLIISKAVARNGIKNSYSDGSDYITFKEIYQVYDVANNGTGAVYALSEHLIGATKQGVYRSLDGGETWNKMGDLEIDQKSGIWYDFIFVEPFQETIYTIKVTNGYNSPAHNFIETFDSNLSKIGSMDIGTARMLSGQHSIDACANKEYTERVVIFGEYVLDDAKTARLWRTTDRGKTWTKVMEKTANNGVSENGEIRHFHAVCCDPYTFDWWACSGDGDKQCKIWRSKDDGVTWDELYAKGQQTRTLQFVFEKDCIYYAMDSTLATKKKFTKLFKINRKDMSVTEVADIKDNFAVYNITRTYMPDGLLIWACNEGMASVDAESVCIQFYDYNSGTVKEIYNFPFNGIKNSYRGFQAASRRQNEESGNIFFMPTINIGQALYGTMDKCSRYFKAKYESLHYTCLAQAKK